MKKRSIKPCATCGNEFVSVGSGHLYCSGMCRRKAEPVYRNRLEIKKKCVICGNNFITSRKIQKYCSNECHLKANKARSLAKKNTITYNTAFLKMRFQVFERDKFRCRYCGRGAMDDVVLVVDHIVPKAKNGENALNNYVTACRECNSGKSDILLLANKGGQLPSFMSI